LKIILRFLREVTRLGKNLRAPKQILRAHFAEFSRQKYTSNDKLIIHHSLLFIIQTNNSMSSINSQTDPFPQSNGLTYFVNNVSNLKRFHILIPNYADEVSIQHFFYIALFQNLL